MGYKVAVLMGSPNDGDKMAPAAATLERYGIEADVKVMSAHRSPALVSEFISGARDAGYQAVICGAGMAAHLAGAAAAGLHNRSIPVGVIVIDYHHWVNMGDWSFDSKAWPDVPGMMDTLKGYGMRVMVSAWPFSATGSGSIGNVSAQGLAVMDGANASPVWWDDNNFS